MNTPGLFIIGAMVTLLVVGALALVIYGAILDGRVVDGSEAGPYSGSEPDTADRGDVVEMSEFARQGQPDPDDARPDGRAFAPGA